MFMPLSFNIFFQVRGERSPARLGSSTTVSVGIFGKQHIHDNVLSGAKEISMVGAHLSFSGSYFRTDESLRIDLPALQ